MSTKGLGKGFGSLLPSDFDESLLLDKKDRVQKLLITDIIAHSDQPRKIFAKQELEELAVSVKRFGILQPIIVMPHETGYIIVAGERRYRAAQLAGLTHVPALIRTLKELERLEIALVENVQRVDLSPLEQARSIARLNQEFNLSLETIAKRLGKAQTTVVNSVRLLQLPEFVQRALEGREITEGHARSVLALNDQPDKQKELLSSIKNHRWSVRQAEQFVQNAKNKPANKREKVSSDLSPLQTKQLQSLRKKLGREVKLTVGQSSINLHVPYSSPKDLESILSRLNS
jgi:ParB family chromosome partitioning protein